MEERKFSLYIVATPIGNIKDITLRALEILKDVDFILCEDTRQTIKLLNHYEIKKPLVSYHKFNEASSVKGIINRLASGERAALVSDAGTPLISDPGQILTDALIEANIPFCVLPGANALLPSIIMSSFSAREFHFAGFLPSKKGERTEKLREYLNMSYPVILYVSPHELRKILFEIDELCDNRTLALNKEITKLYEDVIRGNAQQLLDNLSEEIKGEYTLVISPKIKEETASSYSEEEIKQFFDEFIAKGLDRKGALASLSKKTGKTRNQLYSILFVDEE